jgi:hypothetical protein
MSDNAVSIIVPVGPDPRYKDFLMECLTSIVEQMQVGDEILIVDDMAFLSPEFLASVPAPEGAAINYVRTEWLIGCADAWNMGVSLARNEWCILMGSDDKLLPDCLDICRKEINRPGHDLLGYFNLTCLLDTGELVTAFNNAALVSRSLWIHTGGFPPSAGVGAPDALMVSILLVHGSQHLIQLHEGKPLYWVRSGEHQDTRKQAAPFNWEVIRVRDIETARWTHPAWCDSVQRLVKE